MLASWGKTRVHSYFVATKPLDHRPFQQQVAKKLAVSPEVIYGGVRTQVSALGGTRDLLLLLVYNIESEHIWHPNKESNIYFVGYPKYVLCMLLISIPLTSQGYLII